MKKTKLFKSLLVAAGLLAGSASAWADGNKRVLESLNYEAATASDWTCPNGSAVLKTGDATYGTYAQCYPSGSGNRSCYKSVSYNYDNTGYTTADMTTLGYNIEFDFLLVGGNVVERSVSQLIVPTTGPNLAINASYSGSDYIFALTQPSLAAEGVNEGKNAGNTGTAVTTWYINDLSNATTATVELNGSTWYHLKLVVSATSVDYTISHGTTTDATGSKAVTEIPTIKGIFDLLGRGSGKLNFDNLDIYDYTENISVSAPTFTFKKVDGANRIYTLSNPDGDGTLYYTTSAADEAPEIGSDAYSSTESTSFDVTYSESGNYYAYVLHTNGTATSSVTTQAVTAGELTLAAPTFTITDFVLAEDGYYYPQVTFASNNSSLEGAPTATFDKTSPYTFTGTGELTVTASAEGYTSDSATFTVNYRYKLSKTIDFGALTADDFDATVWESASGAPRDYWTNRAAAIPADVTYYKLIDPSTEGAGTALSGITISNAAAHDPQVYIGYGLLTPYYQGVSGNNMNLTVNDATAKDYVVYNGWNNYGSGTFNTVLAGNATFGLYRYDTMLRTLKVYSPEKTTFTAKYYNTKGWEKVYAYTYNEETLGPWNDTQSGTELTAGEDGLYNVTFESVDAPEKIIFNNGESGEGNQTDNLDFVDGAAYNFDGQGDIYSFTFTTNKGWSNVYAYTWSGADDTKVEQLGAWNGTQLTATDGTYALTFVSATAPEYIIFHNGEGTQTADLTFTDGENYEFNTTYTVAGSNTDMFGTAWDETNTDNDMTKNEDGTYSITYTNVALTENVSYKVVVDHAWGVEYPAENRVIGISMAGNYDVTIHFNPNTGEVYETMNVYKTITDAGYATFCAPYDLNFEGTGVKAYVGTQSGATVTFTEVASAKEGTGLLLKAAEGSYAIAMETSENTVENNALVGVLEDTQCDAGIFVLMNTTEYGVGFYKTTKEFTVGANTAYIKALPASGSRNFIALNFDDDTTTAIEGVATVKMESDAIFNLQGQRVNAAKKGLYIVNGKKMILK